MRTAPFLIPLSLGAALLVGLAAPEARADETESPYRGGRFDTREPPPPPHHDGFIEREPRCERGCDERDYDGYGYGSASTLRVHVGPALLLQPFGTGLLTALDIGEHAVGGRLSGAWLHAGSDSQLSAYSGELWIDFRHRYALHPIVGAGASFLHGNALGTHPNAGAGLLRGTLEYELPVVDADARVGLSLVGLIPAIATERTRPWAALSLSVGAGF